MLKMKLKHLMKLLMQEKLKKRIVKNINVNSTNKKENQTFILQKQGEWKVNVKQIPELKLLSNKFYKYFSFTTLLKKNLINVIVVIILILTKFF